ATRAISSIAIGAFADSGYGSRTVPVVISGLLVAGILGAAMGSLSAALNSMANSTVADIVRGWSRRAVSDAAMLRLGRFTTLVWAVLMALFAMGFSTTTGNVYLTALAIAGYTYGALLGAFLLGRLVRRANQFDAIVAFAATVIVMAFVVRVVQIEVTVAGTVTEKGIAAQWLVPIGVAVTLVVGGVSSRFHPAPEPAPPPESVRAVA
ncbi:sodium:solute symporter family transporter, partial [Nocardia wallacei]|uniref:sodium:solute symporter family transporter n=1 Tax=Nocardia wallacei TaxID=480035 RepID=UPI003CC7C771